ncbi:MAG: hypothetical protein GX213_00405 [Clostridiaceae bacterium]|nr:hypothetical protein [Clostridiaceae bacterium]
MAFIYIDFDEGIPRLAYSGCSRCSSLIGVSLSQIKNRGCCYYSPKFYPVEIQRMCHSEEGLAVLDSIISMPDTVIHDDHILVKGSYDIILHEKMMKDGLVPLGGNVTDTSVFFRTCPFVRSGSGCTLSPRYRSYVCNFFICSEILDNPDYKDKLKPYLRERENYIRFLEWENNQLIMAMRGEGLTFRKNLNGAIEFLKNIGINQYDFPKLEPIVIPDNHTIGA